MDKEKIISDRLKVFEKLIKNGYSSDKNMMNMKVEDLILKTNMNRGDLMIAIGIKNSLANRNLVSYLCGNEEGDKK